VVPENIIGTENAILATTSVRVWCKPHSTDVRHFTAVPGENDRSLVTDCQAECFHPKHDLNVSFSPNFCL